jgi:hypothetical protein
MVKVETVRFPPIQGTGPSKDLHRHGRAHNAQGVSPSGQAMLGRAGSNIAPN